MRGFTLVELLVVIAIVILLALLLLSTFISPVFDFLSTLAFGWIGFLWELPSRLRLNAASVVASVVVLLVFVLGLHRVLMSFNKEIATGPAVANFVEQRSGGRIHSTIAITGTVLVAFGAGICSVAIAHQITWLITSPERMWKDVGGRRASARSQSMNNLKQVGLSTHNFHDRNKVLPPGDVFDASGNPRHSWQTALLPYVDEMALSRQIHRDRAWFDPLNEPVFRKIVRTYFNPGIPAELRVSARGLALSHYAANRHVVARRGLSIQDINDGTSNTIFAGEVKERFRPWGHPANSRDPGLGVNRFPDGFGGPSKGGSQFLFLDGSVRFVNETIGPKVLRALATPNGGEDVTAWDRD